MENSRPCKARDVQNHVAEIACATVVKVMVANIGHQPNWMDVPAVVHLKHAHDHIADAEHDHALGAERECIEHAICRLAMVLSLSCITDLMRMVGDEVEEKQDGQDSN